MVKASGTLPIYADGLQGRSRRRPLLLAALAFAAFIYGAGIAVFPPAFYTLFAVPLIVLAALAIWSLPDTAADYSTPIRKLYWCYLASLFLWPTYLAVALPGLPWINVQRLFLVPLALLFIFSLATSKRMRTELGEVLWANPLSSKLFMAFVALQFLTIPFSPGIGVSTNKVFINQGAWTGIFLISCWMFRDEVNRRRWYKYFLILVLVTAAEALLEYYLQQVPWRDHIPSFLKESDDYLQSNTRRATGLYRVKGFTVNTLVLAEVMAVATPFVLHAIFTSKKLVDRLAWLAYLPIHFFVIVATDARLGTVGFFVSLIIYGAWWSLQRWRERKEDPFAPAMVLAYPLGALAFVGLALTWTRLYRMIFGGGANAASDIARQTQWDMMWPKLLHWPFGNGADSSGVILGFIDETGLRSVDSYFITMLLEYGVIGFVVFFALFLIPSAQLTLAATLRPRGKADLALPVGIALFVFVVIKSVLSLYHNHSLIFMILGLGMAILYRLQVPESDGNAEATR